MRRAEAYKMSTCRTTYVCVCACTYMSARLLVSAVAVGQLYSNAVAMLITVRLLRRSLNDWQLVLLSCQSLQCCMFYTFTLLLSLLTG